MSATDGAGGISEANAARTLTVTDEKIDHALALFAKLTCSGVFVVGREVDEFVRNDIHTHVRPEGNPFDWDDVQVAVDHAAGTVTFSHAGRSRYAQFHPGQGCTIIPQGESGVHFTPEVVERNTPPAETTPWPMGDLLSGQRSRDDIDRAALDAAMAQAFDDDLWPGGGPQRTRSLVVVHRGELVAERYAPGFGPHVPHVSWSMGKSITSALIGILVGQGELALDDPAPVAEWQGADDPRRAITVRDLLQMSSGLQFMRAQDEGELDLGWTRRDDHMLIYFGAVNVFEHARSRPLVDPPGSAWRYRNSDPLTLGSLVRQIVEARGESYLTFPQRALFDRIGMRQMTLEPDPWGNFVMSGFDYGTSRDWARFALLHLWDGVWKPTGERILPEGWVDFVRTPAPADAELHYGGQFWLNAGGRWADLPRDAFTPLGAWGQVALTIPSQDLVVVRHGHSGDTGDPFNAMMNATVRDIARVLGA